MSAAAAARGFAARTPPVGAAATEAAPAGAAPAEMAPQTEEGPSGEVAATQTEEGPSGEAVATQTVPAAAASTGTQTSESSLWCPKWPVPSQR